MRACVNACVRVCACLYLCLCMLNVVFYPTLKFKPNQIKFALKIAGNTSKTLEHTSKLRIHNNWYMEMECTLYTTRWSQMALHSWDELFCSVVCFSVSRLVVSENDGSLPIQSPTKIFYLNQSEINISQKKIQHFYVQVCSKSEKGNDFE